MRKYYKVLILAVILIFTVTSVNVNAAVGYTYSHSGEPIYSTVGLSVTKDGIYTVISDNWTTTNSENETLQASDFTSPEDLFLYTEYDQNGNGKDVIYVVDSISNNLFVFDEDISFIDKVDKFEVRPEDFSDDEVLKFRTRFTQGTNVTSISFTDYLLKKDMNLAKFRDIEEIPYEERTEDQKFYIEGNGLSGVYRNTRPLKDENGANIKGEVQDLIYLSDKLNNQIIIVDAKTYRVVQVVSTPTDVSFTGKVFMPVRLVTENVTGRMYVISEGVYEGIMQMTYDGEFSSFIGVNYVTMSMWDSLWRRFMTDEQLAQQTTTLNTIFTSLAIDEKGFIYTTSRAVNDTDDSKMIKRINPSGKDVLTRNGYDVPKGDLVYIRTGNDATVRGPSRFSAIAVNEYGVYTVADQKSGRLFTYDDEGNLLYISGGSGNELNTINNPVAIQYQGDNIIALDKKNQSILRFEPTDIAVVINKAVEYHYNGNLVASSEEWKNVVAKNPNYEYAYVGIGKSLLNEGRYQEAMSYFQTGYNVSYYSKAYKLYRDEQIEKYFTSVMSVVLVLVGAYVGYNTYRNIRYKKDKETGIGDE